MARVVVIEPWYGGSHRVWADSWRANSRHELDFLTLPAQFWRWRMRAGAVALSDQFAAYVDERGRPDAVVLSGMLDAATFAGMARRALGDVAIAVYMHENQLLYPLAPNQRPDMDLGLVNWRSMLVADRIWWNSAFHKDAFLTELPRMLFQQPEPPDPSEHELTAARSRVLWPGVESADLIDAPRRSKAFSGTGRPLVLWNQRWDHDKNPRAVFKALHSLAIDGVEFDLALAGENQGHSDDEQWVLENLGDRIVHRGWLERADYRALLLRSDVMVSAADHEFFGIAIVEAIAAGVMPVLPDRLSFPELIEPQWHDAVLYPDGDLRVRLGAVLRDLTTTLDSVPGLRESMRRFDVVAAGAAHDDAVDDLVAPSIGA